MGRKWTRDNQEWGLKWPDKVFSPLFFFLNKPVHEWPVWIRRLYLITFPVSFILKYTFICIIFSIGIMSLALAYCLNTFYCTWYGKKNGFSSLE